MRTTTTTVVTSSPIVIRLSAVPESSTVTDEEKRVQWEGNTIDNEFMGKKSSKRCCIFHKQKKFGEDSSDSSSSESDDSTDDFDTGKKISPSNDNCNHSHASGEKGEGSCESSNVQSHEGGPVRYVNGIPIQPRRKAIIKRAKERTQVFQNCEHCRYIEEMKERRRKELSEEN